MRKIQIAALSMIIAFTVSALAFGEEPAKKLESFYVVKNDVVKADLPGSRYTDAGPENDFRILDIFGKPHDLPLSFGVAELYPSKGAAFDYGVEGTAMYMVVGSLTLTDTRSGNKIVLNEGDAAYITLEEGKIVEWSSDVYSKFVYATYPHWQ